MQPTTQYHRTSIYNHIRDSPMKKRIDRRDGENMKAKESESWRDKFKQFKISRDMTQNSIVQPVQHVVMCLEHGKPRELICIKCQKKVCHTCALFGSHKGHDVREKNETMNEIQLRMEVLIEMYSLVDLECQKLGE